MSYAFPLGAKFYVISYIFSRMEMTITASAPVSDLLYFYYTGVVQNFHQTRFSHIQHSTKRLSHFMFLQSTWFGHKESMALLTGQIFILHSHCVRGSVCDRKFREAVFKNCAFIKWFQQPRITYDFFSLRLKWFSSDRCVLTSAHTTESTSASVWPHSFCMHSCSLLSVALHCLMQLKSKHECSVMNWNFFSLSIHHYTPFLFLGSQIMALCQILW